MKKNSAPNPGRTLMEVLEERSDYGSWRTFLIVPEPPHEVLPELHPAGEPSAEAEAFYASLRRKIQCLRRLERAVRVGMVEDNRLPELKPAPMTEAEKTAIYQKVAKFRKMKRAIEDEG